MSDTLSAWMSKYIENAKQGMEHPLNIGICKIDQAEFDRGLRENDAFKNAMELVGNGVCATEITADKLLQLRRAQVSKARCAGFFGLELEAFEAQLEAREDLKRIWDTGHLRGQAEIQMAQFAVALSGDAGMLQHQGKQYLDQEDKKTLKIEGLTGDLDAAIKVIEDRMRQLTGKVIEGSWEDIEDEEEGDVVPELTDQTESDIKE